MFAHPTTGSKVTYFEFLVTGNHEIFRFDVTMHDMQAVEERQPCEQLPEPLLDFDLGHGLALEDMFEVTRTLLHHEV